MPNDIPEDPVARNDYMRTLFESSKWESAWQAGIVRGDHFDKLHALPELVHQIANKLLPGGKNALIPGCGRGYDVEVLSRSGLYEHVYGLDISPTGVEEASKYLESVNPALPQNWTLKTCDFFDTTVFNDKFALVYDYTFLCALKPGMRSKWAQRMAEVLEVGGSLVTVMYPAHKTLDEGGPPFACRPEMYDELLEKEGKFVKKDGPTVLADNRAHKDRGDGKTLWCRWERV